MKVVVPPSRITIFTNHPDEGCSIQHMTSRNEVLNLEGGGESKKTKYILLKTNGEKLSSNHVYEANRPAAAALKAYFALSRKAKHLWTQKEIDKSSEYYNLLEKQLFAPPGIITLRKIDNMKILQYKVEYEPNYKPNKHEIEKQIFKKAKVTKLDAVVQNKDFLYSENFYN